MVEVTRIMQIQPKGDLSGNFNIMLPWQHINDNQVQSFESLMLMHTTFVK